MIVRKRRSSIPSGASGTARSRLRHVPSRPSSERTRSAIVTLQSRAELVRFRGDMKGAVTPRSLRVRSLEGLDGTWRSLESAVPLAPLGIELRRFRTIMQPPERLR